MNGLAIEPQHRQQTVREFRQALVDAGPVPAGPAKPPVPPPAPAPKPKPAPRPSPAPGPATDGDAPRKDRRWLVIGIPTVVASALGTIWWVGGSKSPRVTAVDFPAEITVGRTATLRITFEDADADVERMEFVSREGSWKIPNQDLRSRYANQTQGTVEVPMTARSPEKARLDVVIHDHKGNRSSPREISFVSVAPPTVPPVLQRVNAPTTATAGQAFMTRTFFEDADGDVRRLIVKPLTAPGNFPPVELTGVQRQGQITYQITVANPGRYAYSYQLQDAQGKVSNVVQIEVNVLAAPQRATPAPAPSQRFAPAPPAPPPGQFSSPTPAPNPPNNNSGQPPAPPPADPGTVRPAIQDATRLLHDILRGSGLKR